MYLNNINKQIPSKILHNKEITKKIEDILYWDATVTEFCEVDDLDQDMLIALGMESLDHDIELTIDVSKFARYLKSYSRDLEIDITASLRDQAKEYFTPIFDEMIAAHKDYVTATIQNEYSGDEYKNYSRGELPW